MLKQGGALLSIDAAAEARRAATVAPHVAPLAPELARYTDEVLFADLWRRPDLTARDRSLVTVAALITQGQSEQLPFHLNRAMDNGLTQVQVGEVITHLAFYAGWPNAMSAIPVAQSVIEQRSQQD
jgi:4-carboxymuconolactone decarboxylase